jgi:hypothetical protein
MAQDSLVCAILLRIRENLVTIEQKVRDDDLRNSFKCKGYHDYIG